MKTIRRTLKEILRYPSAILGLIMVLILLIVSAFAMISIPYDQAIILWRGGEEVWYQNPKNAPPAWFNWFTKVKQPESFVINQNVGDFQKTVDENSDGSSVITLTYSFDYQYDAFPQDMLFYIDSVFTSKQPFASITWVTPDGRQIRAGALRLLDYVRCKTCE